MKVFKYDVRMITGEFITFMAPCQFAVKASSGAMPLSVQLQQQFPKLWMKSDPNDPIQLWHVFEVVGTGDDVQPHWEYVGTVQEDRGRYQTYAWHLFRIGRSKEEPPCNRGSR